MITYQWKRLVVHHKFLITAMIWIMKAMKKKKKKMMMINDNNQLNPDVPDMDWRMNCTGNHEILPFTVFTTTNFTLEKDKRNRFSRKTFFYPNQHRVITS